MSSLFDSEAFNGALFFPRNVTGEPGSNALDSFVDVGGARLHLRRHSSPQAHLQLLYFHGNREVVSECDPLAPPFARLGCELVVVDYRGYGRSTGSPTLRTLLADAHEVAAAALAGSPLPLMVMGRSLGSLAAGELYAQPPARLLGVIYESGLSSLTELVRRRGLRPPGAFTPEELEAFEPLRKLARGTLPLLILHGANDRSVKPAEARASFEQAGGAAKQLALIPGAGHTDLPDAPEAWSAIAAFLSRLESEAPR